VRPSPSGISSGLEYGLWSNEFGLGLGVGLDEALQAGLGFETGMASEVTMSGMPILRSLRQCHFVE